MEKNEKKTVSVTLTGKNLFGMAYGIGGAMLVNAIGRYFVALTKANRAHGFMMNLGVSAMSGLFMVSAKHYGEELYDEIVNVIKLVENLAGKSETVESTDETDDRR